MLEVLSLLPFRHCERLARCNARQAVPPHRNSYALLVDWLDLLALFLCDFPRDRSQSRFTCSRNSVTFWDELIAGLIDRNSETIGAIFQPIFGVLVVSRQGNIRVANRRGARTEKRY